MLAGEQWIGKDLLGSGRDRIKVLSRDFLGGDKEITEIRTKDLQDTSQERYRFVSRPVPLQSLDWRVCNLQYRVWKWKRCSSPFDICLKLE
jgi:hypothetical protein